MYMTVKQIAEKWGISDVQKGRYQALLVKDAVGKYQKRKETRRWTI